MAEPLPFEPVAAFGPLLRRAGTGRTAGIAVRERTGLAMVSLALRRGREAALREAAMQGFGILLPDGPRRVEAAGVAFIGTAPGGWLACGEGSGWRLAADLRRRFEGLAAVCDQSSAYGVLAVSGPRVRDLLAKGFAIDLAPSAFGPGDAAGTRVAHVDVRLWQVDDAPTYEIAVPRSLAGSFWHWLEVGAAEFGLSVAES